MTEPRYFARRTESGFLAIFDKTTEQRISTAFYWSPEQAGNAADDMNAAYEAGLKAGEENKLNQGVSNG